jgi:acetyl esterase/lipase
MELKLDLAAPLTGQRPFPALVYILGNGWGYYADVDRRSFYYDIREAARRGYVAVTVDIRSIRPKENGKTKYPFPSQLYDAKGAIRWLRQHAEEYGVDANCIGAIGFSSGGHLSLLLGATSPNDGLEGDVGDLSVSSAVQAVVSMCGPTASAEQLFGQDCVASWGEISPIKYATADDPPVLMVYGSKDGEVRLDQAKLLDQALSAAGVQHKFIIRNNFGHANAIRDRTVRDEIFRFFESCLKKNNR